MKKTGKSQTDDRGGALPRHVCCPLCRHAVDISEFAGDGQVMCDACHLTFNALDAAERLQQQEIARAAATCPTDSAPVDPLQKWLSGSPLEPPKRTRFQELMIWAGRHRWIAGSTSAGFLALTVAVVSLLMICRNLSDVQRQTARERDDARLYCERLEDEAEQAARSLDQRVNEGILRRQRELRIEIAGEIADDAKALAPQAPEQSLALAVLAMRLTHRERLSPDQATLQLIHQLTTRADDTASKLLGRVDILAASPDGRWLAGGSPNGNIRLLDLQVASGELQILELASPLNHVAALVFTSDGRWLMARGLDSTISAWRLDRPDIEKQERLVLRVPESRIVDLAIGGDNRWVLGCCNGFRPGETTIRLWDLTAADPSAAYVDLSGNQGRVKSVAMSKNGQWVAVGNVGGTIALWNSASPQPHTIASMLRSGKGSVHSLHFTPDSRRLIAAAGNDGQEQAIHLWDLTAGDPTAAPLTLRGHAGTVQKIALTADGRWLASAGENDRIRLWDLTGTPVDQCVATFEGLTGKATSLEFSADGRSLVAAGAEGNACLWNTACRTSSRPLLRFPASESPLTSLVFARDGRWLATSSADQIVRLWTLSADDALDQVVNDTGRARPISTAGLFLKPAGASSQSPQANQAGKPSVPTTPPSFARPASPTKPAPFTKPAPASETAVKPEPNPLR